MTAPDALRRAAAALHLLASERAAVARALRGDAAMPALDGFARDRAAAVSALSEALRLLAGPRSDAYHAFRSQLLLFAGALTVGAEDLGPPWPLSNVDIGVSVEDRRFGLPRIEHLRSVPIGPGAVRFLSIEPLLEDLGAIDLTGIGWVIVGGESGPGAREMEPAWVRSLRDQCVAAGVPFFFKQWGGVRKKLRGRLLDGRTWDEMPARSGQGTLSP